MGKAAPKAQGDTGSLPLERVLCTGHGKQLTGTLVVWPEAEEGEPDRLRWSRGYIDRVVLASPTQGGAEDDLLAVLARERVPFAFYTEDLTAGVGDARWVDPLGLVLASLRRGVRPGLLRAEKARLGSKTLRVPPEALLARLKLTPDERALMERVSAGDTTMDALIAESAQPALARRVACLLALLRGFAKATSEPAPSSRPSLRAPSSRPSLRAPSSWPASDTHALPSTPSSDVFPSVTPPSSATPSVRPSSSGVRATGARRSSRRPPRSGGHRSLRPQASDAPSAASKPVRIWPSTAPKGVSTPGKLAWQELHRWAEQLEAQSYFEMLGVRHDAAPYEIREGYAAKAMRFKPETLAPELEAIRPLAEQVHAWLKDARNVLLDPDLRSAYRVRRARGAGSPSTMRAEAEREGGHRLFERARALSKAHRHDEALDALDRCLEVAPTTPQYLAMKAKMLLELRRVLDDATQAAVEGLLSTALAVDPDHVESLVLRGRLSQRLGRSEEAVRDYRRAAHLDPKNLEANREIRLAGIRKRHKAEEEAAAAESGGAFGRWRRKKR